MNKFNVHTFGHVIEIEAHHFMVDKEMGLVQFYKSESEIDETWTIFLHGVAAIETLGKPIPATVRFGNLRM